LLKRVTTVDIYTRVRPTKHVKTARVKARVLIITLLITWESQNQSL